MLTETQICSDDAPYNDKKPLDRRQPMSCQEPDEQQSKQIQSQVDWPNMRKVPGYQPPDTTLTDSITLVTKTAGKDHFQQHQPNTKQDNC